LHRQLVGVAGVTDIVTLEHRRAGRGAPLVGEVYIAPEVAAAQARDLGVPLREEIARLVVHGVLHVLGWEHPHGDAAARARSPMWQRQERVLTAARRAGVLT
jgi:probable rRNA maturation factor